MFGLAKASFPKISENREHTNSVWTRLKSLVLTEFVSSAKAVAPLDQCLYGKRLES